MVGSRAVELSQVLSTVRRQGVTYELTVEVGNGLPANPSFDYVIELLAGGTVLATANGLVPAGGTFETSVTSFTPQASDPIGQPLEIRLAGDGVYFDNVRLVPEPSTAALVGLGLAGLAMRRTRPR